MKPPSPQTIIAGVFRHTLRSTVRMPPVLAYRLFGQPPRNDRGAELDYQTHVFLNVSEALDAPQLEDMSPQEAREVYERASSIFDLRKRPLHKVEDRTIPGPETSLPVRIYRPRPGVLPACVFFHGGGFVIGNIAGYDGFCRALAERANCVVVSVDYRLAPEHTFPAPVNDSVAAFRWVRENAQELGVDPARIAVGGDSAGGNLAAVVCQQQVELDEPLPSHQLLIYPRTDQRPGDYPSREHFSEGFYLNEPLLEWFADHYLAGAPAADPRISPMMFDDLQALPPAVILTAGFDPLRDEGERYGHELAEAGVPVVQECYDSLIHGFVTMGGLISAAENAVLDLAGLFGREVHR